MRINIIGKSNGVGLSRDLTLLAGVLRDCGCDVRVLAVDSRTSHRRRSPWVQAVAAGRCWWQNISDKSPASVADANIMMEHLWPESLPEARLNIAVPNPEWFDRHDLRLLSHIDRIWAKTTNTQQIFQRLKCDTSLIEFDSEDRFDPAAPRQRSFFHLAGKSTMKGTARLLKLWQAHRQWPTLTVVQHASADQPAPAGNIDYRSEYLDDVELRRLQNESLFHLCPSETEGWGHYLVEAMSVGAIAITLDAPPMNELVTAERGLLIAAHKSRMQKLAQCFEFDEASCVAAIERAIAMKDQEIAELSTAARQWFLSNKMGFRQRVKNALTALPGQS